MRLFIAVPLPAPIKDYIKEIQDNLKKTGADVKWVEPANCHLTLKFLGETAETQAEAVRTTMRESVGGINSFQISLSGLGGFPSATSPRVVWVGITEGIVQAKEIAARLEEKLSFLGLTEDRPFSAHITIGRVRSSRNRKELANALRVINEKAKPPCPFGVNAIVLFQSKLSPKGPTYIPLFEASLTIP